MKLRCRTCGSRLGLGIVSQKVYVPERWWFITVRFCGRACRDAFLQKKVDDLERRKAIAAIYHPP